MYRIIVNSWNNYAADFGGDISNPRYRPVHFMRLLTDPRGLEQHRDTEDYTMLRHFLWQIRDCERSSQILHELKMLGIEGAPASKPINYVDETMEEANRVWQMFLSKAYWR